MGDINDKSEIDNILLNKLTIALKMMLINTPIQFTEHGKSWCEKNNLDISIEYTIDSINADETINIYSNDVDLCVENVLLNYIILS